ncbi:MAG TPA: hypothetical protein VMD91_10595 [Candidatus Sulfotelmatobacter sp.]|nr:hypothetical protein [Candidatus Sulfotelmatobacter sp.]
MRLEATSDDNGREFVRLHGAEHQIERAHCVDLNETLEIFGARNAFWAQAPDTRRRFRFECPDDECRELFHPTIAGVNYDKLVNDRDLGNHLRAPHFRWIEAAAHSATCELVVDALARAEVAKEAGPVASPDDALGQRLTTYKATDYVDVFVIELPKRGAKGPTSRDLLSPGRVSSFERRRTLVVERRAALRANLTESRVLQSIVSCHQRLAAARVADKAKLRIGGVWRTYYEWFCPMGRAAAQDENRIWYGGASVRKYGERYSVRFYDRIAVSVDRLVPLGIVVTTAELDASRDGRYYREVLDQVLATRGGYVTCWVYGRIVLSSDSARFETRGISDMVFAPRASRREGPLDGRTSKNPEKDKR